MIGRAREGGVNDRKRNIRCGERERERKQRRQRETEREGIR